jgi:hypothetical protein
MCYYKDLDFYVNAYSSIIHPIIIYSYFDYKYRRLALHRLLWIIFVFVNFAYLSKNGNGLQMSI